MRVGIVSTEFALFDHKRNRASFESRRIKEQVEAAGGETMLLDPTQVFFRFGRSSKPRILYGGGTYESDVIETLDILLVKRTRHMSEQIADLVAAVDAFCPGIEIFDPPGCYSRPVSKVESYILREAAGVNHPTTLIACSDALDQSDMDLEPPVLSKPTHGTQGHGIQLLKTDVALANAIRKSRVERSEFGAGDESYGLHLQEHLDFDAEYRVMTIGGKSIGIAERVREAGWGAGQHSALPSADFEKCTDDIEAIDVAERAARVHNYSFAGVDVLRCGEELFVLECNRNPQFSKFERATDIDVATKMVDYMFKSATSDA